MLFLGYQELRELGTLGGGGGGVVERHEQWALLVKWETEGSGSGGTG